MSFDLQPTLTGERVQLRPLATEDWNALFAVASDPLVWEQHPNSDRYQRDVFEAFFKQAIESGGAFAVIDLAADSIIGSTRFCGYNEARSEIEIGWTFLARSHWGGTYNREMKRLMLRHAFQFVENVLFFVGPNNLRSQRAMEKIGGERLGIRLGVDGKEHVVFRIRADAFRRDVEIA